MSLNRTVPPAYHNINTVHIPPLETLHLDNDTPLYVLNSGEQPVLKLEIIFEAGTWHESQAGASFFALKMLAEGTKSRKSLEISEFFDQHGASFDFGHGVDRAGFTLHCLGKHLPKLLPVVSDMLQNPLFPETELETLKRITGQNLRVNQEKNAYVAGQVFREKLFGKTHPYGFSMSAEAIDGITVDALKTFYEQSIQHNSYRIFLSGKISSQEKTLINEYFGQKEQPIITPEIQHQLSHYQGIEAVIERQDSVQSSIRMGNRTIGRSHAHYAQLLVANEVLGGYFGSRLVKNIREEKGFTYGISSGTPQLSKASYFIIGTDVKKEDTQATIDEIGAEIAQLQTDLVGQEELERAKNFMIGQFAGSLNTPFEIADRYKLIILENLPSHYYEGHIDRIRGVTAEQVRETARNYWNDLTTVVVGGK